MFGTVCRLCGPLRSSCLPPRDGALLGRIGTTVTGRASGSRRNSTTSRAIFWLEHRGKLRWLSRGGRHRTLTRQCCVQPNWAPSSRLQNNFVEFALACSLRLSVRLNSSVQMSPRDDTSSSDRADTHAILMRVGTHFGLTLTNLASADRTSKSLCRYDGSTAPCSLRPSRRSAHETSTHRSHTFTSDLSIAETAEHTQSA